MDAIAADIQTVASQLSVQNTAVEPESKATKVEANSQAIDIQTENIELMVQLSKTESVLQAMSMTEALSASDEVSTVAAQVMNIPVDSVPFTQKLGTGPEIQAKPEFGIDSESVASETHARLPRQESEAQPEIQQEAEFMVTPRTAEVSKLEPNIQREATEVPTQATEVPAQEPENGFEVQAEAEIAASSDLTKTRMDLAQPIIQKSEDKTEIPTVTETEAASDSAKVNIAESENRAADIQPEANVQSAIRKSEAESVSKTQSQSRISSELIEVYPKTFNHPFNWHLSFQCGRN